MENLSNKIEKQCFKDLLRNRDNDQLLRYCCLFQAASKPRLAILTRNEKLIIFVIYEFTSTFKITFLESGWVQKTFAELVTYSDGNAYFSQLKFSGHNFQTDSYN